MYHDVLKVVQLHRLQEHELRMRSLALSGHKEEDCHKSWRALEWRQKTVDQSWDFLNKAAKGKDGREKIMALFDFKKLPTGIYRLNVLGGSFYAEGVCPGIYRILYAGVAFCMRRPHTVCSIRIDL